MRYYNILFFLFIALITLNCSFRPCSNIVGRYNNKHDKTIINYLDLNKDGTYFHYYKKDTLELSEKGNWNRSKDDYCIIELKNWKSYEFGKKYEDYGIYLLFINGKYLNNGPDGDSVTSFEK